MIAGPAERVASITASHAALRDAVAVARLAPSSHNSQPWALASFESADAVRGLGAWLGIRPRADERWLVLAIDGARALQALPSLNTEMRLSCGIFLQLLCAALADRGLAVRVVSCADRLGVRPVAGYPASWVPLAAVAVSSGAPRRAGWSAELAPLRRTNRAPYEPRPVDDAAKRGLASSEAVFAIAQEAVSVTLIDDREIVRAVGDFVGHHASVDFTDSSAWSETYRFMRFSARAAASRADGFALTQLFGRLPPGVAQLLQVGLSPPSMRVLRYLGVPALMAKGLGRLVGAAPLLACVSVASTSAWTELVAGGVAMDLWMRATASGLAVHPVSAILQHDEIRARFQHLFVPNGRAVFFARCGYPTTTFPATSRRSLEPGPQDSGWLRL